MVTFRTDTGCLYWRSLLPKTALGGGGDGGGGDAGKTQEPIQQTFPFL